jgi:hypothetical protein
MKRQVCQGHGTTRSVTAATVATGTVSSLVAAADNWCGQAVTSRVRDARFCPCKLSRITEVTADNEWRHRPPLPLSDNSTHRALAAGGAVGHVANLAAEGPDQNLCPQDRQGQGAQMTHACSNEHASDTKGAPAHSQCVTEGGGMLMRISTAQLQVASDIHTILSTLRKGGAETC